MNKNGILEIVTFDQAEPADKVQIVNGVRVLDKFYSQFTGYHGIQVGDHDSGSWTLILNWESVESEKEASALMMKSDETNAFKAVVNPPSVKKVLCCNLQL